MKDAMALVALENINVNAARLPALYQGAVQALSECTRIDECADWGNKAESLASYAKQAKDESLRKMADRIQARAIKRCGELLKQIPVAKGANQNIRDGTVPKVTRESAATDAGLSDRQRKTALRVASVSDDEFERQIESDNPPTVTALAEQGKRPAMKPLVDLGGIPPEDFAKATEALGTLRRFAAFCQGNEPSRIAAAFLQHEVNDAKSFVECIDLWLDVFICSLPEGAPNEHAGRSGGQNRRTNGKRGAHHQG